MKHYKLSSITASLLLACSFSSIAQTSEETEKLVERIQVYGQKSQVELTEEYAGNQVARGGRAGLLGNLDFLSSPFSGLAYTSNLVLNQQSESVGDVLQNDPVVRTAKGFGNFQEVYIIRGFPVFSDDITLNGVYGVLPRQFVAAELLERVEVFRGANAFTNGAAPGGSASGGSINLVPKRAPAEGIKKVTLGHEGEDELYGAVDIGHRFGKQKEWGIRGNAVIRDGEGAVKGEETDLNVFSLGTDYAGEKFRFSADLGYQENHIDSPRPQITPVDGIPVAPEADQNFAQNFTFSDEKQLFAAVRGEYDINDKTSVWLGGGFREGEESNDLVNPNVTQAGDLSGFRFINAREDSVYSFDAGVESRFNTADIKHNLVVSASYVDLEFENAFAFSNFGGVNLGTLTNPIQITPPVADAFVSGDLANPALTDRQTNTSIAIADTLSFYDGALLTTFGLRFQTIEAEAIGTSFYDESKVTPAIGVVYRHSDQLSLYANYAENLQPGAAAPEQSGGVPVVNSGDILDPFVGEQIEVGIKYDSDELGGTLSVFSVNRPNSIIDNQVFTDNGEQRNQGVELSVFGQLNENLRIIGGATVLDNELRRTQDGINQGNTSVGTPELQGNINLEYDLPLVPGLTFDGRVIHTGDQYIDAANTQSVGGWTRFDLGVRYELSQFPKPVTIRARLENVFDRNYFATVGGFPGANYLILGNPRTLSLSVSFDL